MSIHNWQLANGNKVMFDDLDNLTFTEVTAYDVVELDGGYIGSWIMGGDRRVLRSARVSNSGGDITTYEKDRKLLTYLWKNKHISPFEQVHLSFTVVCDLRTAMQMDTHRTLTKNRYSRRYSADWTEFIQPVWRIQNTEKGTNKQAGDTVAGEYEKKTWDFRWEEHVLNAMHRYTASLQEGMAREQAAWFLPTGVLTATFYTVSLRHLIDFIFTRCESHAQAEIREIAYTLKNEVIPLTNPWTAELVTKEFETKGWPDKYA